jgi:hypothetical protein
MAHELALTQAWESLADKDVREGLVRFLGVDYAVDVARAKVTDVRGGTPAGDHLALLILHYLARKADGLPAPTGEWLSLSGLSLAAGFADVYVERAVSLIRAEFGPDPERIYAVLEKVPGERVARADAAVVLEVFTEVPMLVDIWRADEEFEADAGLLFDRSITEVFCTEDVVELAETAAAELVERSRPPG